MLASKHSTRERKTSESRPLVKPAETTTADNTLDAVLRDCSQNTTKEQLGWEIATCSALLRGGQQMREAQLEATRKAQQVHDKAADNLKRAHDLGELANIQSALARADFEGAVQLWLRLSELATQSALEVWNESTTGVARLQSAAWTGAMHWLEHQALVGSRSEVLEAEFEHVTNTVAATPLVWPSQEATRQAMTLATSTWNDLLSWSGQLDQAGSNGAARAH